MSTDFECQIKIIVVEDEADILDVIEYNLTREGYKVLGFRMASRVWKRFGEKNPNWFCSTSCFRGLTALKSAKKSKKTR